MALAHGVSRKSWKLLVLPTFSVSQSWKMLVLPTFPTISIILPKIMEIVGFTNIFREPIMENVDFTNISNNFHDFPNYGSGSCVSRKSWKLLELVGLATFSVTQSWNCWFYQQFPRFSKLVLWLTRFLEDHGNCWNCWFYQHFP